MKKLLVLMACLLILPIITYAETMILNETNNGIIDDGYIKTILENDTFSNETSAYMGTDSGNRFRAFLFFNVSPLQLHPTSIINISNANLSLYFSQTYGCYIKAYNISIIDLNETNITWFNQPFDKTTSQIPPNTSVLQDTKATPYNLTAQRRYWNITNSVITSFRDSYQQKIGILLMDTDEISGCYNSFVTKDSITSSSRPQLIVDFSCTPTLTTCGDFSICSNYTQSRNCTDDCDISSIQNNTCYSGNTTKNYCYDNNTMIKDDIVIYNGLEYSYKKPINCLYGCDNSTGSCFIDATPYGWMLFFIILCVIIFILHRSDII